MQRIRGTSKTPEFKNFIKAIFNLITIWRSESKITQRDFCKAASVYDTAMERMRAGGDMKVSTLVQILDAAGHRIEIVLKN